MTRSQLHITPRMLWTGSKTIRSGHSCGVLCKSRELRIHRSRSRTIDNCQRGDHRDRFWGRITTDRRSTIAGDFDLRTRPRLPKEADQVPPPHPLCIGHDFIARPAASSCLHARHLGECLLARFLPRA